MARREGETKSDLCRRLIKESPGQQTAWYARQSLLPATMVSKIRNEHKQQVYEMTDRGLSVDEIAHRLDHPATEIERMLDRYEQDANKLNPQVSPSPTPDDSDELSIDERLDRMAQWCEDLKVILRSQADELSKWKLIKDVMRR